MNLTEGEISDHLRTIAIPASVGFFFNTMFNVVDSFFAGQISTEALASLAISFPVYFIMIALSNGITVGGSALISNALGSKNDREATLYKAQVLSFGLFFSLLITIVGLLASRPLFELLGASGNYLELALSYIHILFYGAVALTINAAANAILLADGNTVVLRNVLFFSFILNCILDPWFLYGGFGVPAMGLQGIALATLCGLLIGNIYILYKVYSNGHFSGIRAIDYLPKLRPFLHILQQSLPASLNMMSIAIGIFVTTYYVQNFGSDAIAALGIGMRIQQIFLLPSLGINIAALAITGQNNGAGLYGRIAETISISLKYGTWIMTTGALLMFFFPSHLLAIFSDDEKVIAIGVEYLQIAALCSWAYMIMSVYNSALQGMKRPNFPFFITLLRQSVAPLLLFHILIDRMKLAISAIWIAILIVTWLCAAIVYLYAKRVLAEKLSSSFHHR